MIELSPKNQKIFMIAFTIFIVIAIFFMAYTVLNVEAIKMNPCAVCQSQGFSCIDLTRLKPYG